MTWPTQPTSIDEIPRLLPESPWYDEAAYLSPGAVLALCRLVGSQLDLLEAITDNHTRSEEIVGSALVAAVLKGSSYPDIAADALTTKVLTGFGRLVGEVTAPDQLSYGRLSHLLEAAVLLGSEQNGAEVHAIERVDNDSL